VKIQKFSHFSRPTSLIKNKLKNSKYLNTKSILVKASLAWLKSLKTKILALVENYGVRFDNEGGYVYYRKK